jgi:parallel beta-helix repeat protein
MTKFFSHLDRFKSICAFNHSFFTHIVAETMAHLFFDRRSLSSALRATARLSLAVTVLSMGSVLPAHAQSYEMGVNAIAANIPIAKPQLFVNSNIGRDDLSAGRNEATPFKTISYALSLAKPGDIIQVSSGLYTQQLGETFPLVVPQGVTLQGSEFNQGSTVTVMGGGRFASSWWGSQDVSILAKSDSQISGLTVTNPNSRGTGIWIEAANVSVRGCTFTKSAREGVFAAGKSNPTIENNLFVDNSANGLAMTGMSTGMVRNNVFQKTGFGIAVSEKSFPQLVNNRVQDNVDGIVVSHSATPQLRGNVIEGNRRDGLVAISSAQPDLGSTIAPGRNIFRNNGRYAIYNATLKNTLVAEGNDINGRLQLSASGPTGVDPNALPELQAFIPGAAAQSQPIAQPAVAAPSAVAIPAVSTAKASTRKMTLDSAKLRQELAKAPTVQYKGKTYILLENVKHLTK